MGLFKKNKKQEQENKLMNDSKSKSNDLQIIQHENQKQSVQEKEIKDNTKSALETTGGLDKSERYRFLRVRTFDMDSGRWEPTFLVKKVFHREIKEEYKYVNEGKGFESQFDFRVDERFTNIEILLKIKNIDYKSYINKLDSKIEETDVIIANMLAKTGNEFKRGDNINDYELYKKRLEILKLNCMFTRLTKDVTVFSTDYDNIDIVHLLRRDGLYYPFNLTGVNGSVPRLVPDFRTHQSAHYDSSKLIETQTGSDKDKIIKLLTYAVIGCLVITVVAIGLTAKYLGSSEDRTREIISSNGEVIGALGELGVQIGKKSQTESLPSEATTIKPNSFKD